MWNDLVGKEFRDGGRGPDAYDCWGLAREAYGRFGKDLPEYRISCGDSESIDSAARGVEAKWRKLDKPAVPCLLVFSFDGSFVTHIGVYIGKGRFIHCREKVGVVIERTDHPYWSRHLVGYYGFKGKGKVKERRQKEGE